VFDTRLKSPPVSNQFIQSIQEANLLTDQAEIPFQVIRQIMEELGAVSGKESMGWVVTSADSRIDKQYPNAYINVRRQSRIRAKH